MIKYLMIHCTATRGGVEYSAEEIKNMFYNYGWRHPGYRHLIHLDGSQSTLLDYDSDDVLENWEITNGAKGYNNTTIHIAYVGGVDGWLKPKDTRTTNQKKSLKTFIQYYALIYPNIKVLGHYKVSNKACPSFNVDEFLGMIGRRDLRLDTELPLPIIDEHKLFDLW